MTLVWFSLCSNLFWALRDNGVVKILQFCPQSLGVVLEFQYIEHGLMLIQHDHTFYVYVN